MPEIKTGLIIRSIGGLYSVESPDGIYECVPRGIFRKEGKSPCVGDRVSFNEENVITDIQPRRNHIIRPPLANMDQLIFVVSPVSILRVLSMALRRVDFPAPLLPVKALIFPARMDFTFSTELPSE